MPKKERNERLNFEIRRVSNKEWNFYKKYHYLTESLPSAHYYEATVNNKKVGFLSINRFMHPMAKDIMVISRIVVVPEFQGFGIGLKLMEAITDLYKNDRIRITTSLKPFIKSLENNKKWKCVRFGRTVLNNKSASETMKRASSKNRITATFEYKRGYQNG